MVHTNLSRNRLRVRSYTLLQTTSLRGPRNALLGTDFGNEEEKLPHGRVAYPGVADCSPWRFIGFQATSPRMYCQRPCSRQIMCNWR
jgi:hypothetical protein